MQRSSGIVLLLVGSFVFGVHSFCFGALGGPNPGSFDWGLPFLFGRNVYTAIEARNTPAGAGPYWAYYASSAFGLRHSASELPA